jgi:hypothetical protein
MPGDELSAGVENVAFGGGDIEFKPLPSIVRVNARPPSVPTTGVSSATPAAARCSGVRLAAETVRMPTRRPGGRRRSISGTCSSA